MSSSPNSSSSEAGLLPETLAPLNDVVCGVDVTLGTAAMSVRDCLALRKGALIRLTKMAGADADVIVNGVVIARAEVVIIDESTAVRLTELVAPPSSEAAE